MLWGNAFNNNKNIEIALDDYFPKPIKVDKNTSKNTSKN
jgi:hypothetical protein